MRTVFVKDACKDIREIINEAERKLEPVRVCSDTRIRQIYEAAKGRKVKLRTQGNEAYIIPTKGASTFVLKKGKNREDGRKYLAEFTEWIKNGKSEVALIEWGGANGYTYTAACAKLKPYRDFVDFMFSDGQETSTWVIKERTQENAEQINMSGWVDTAVKKRAEKPSKHDLDAMFDMLVENEASGLKTDRTANLAARDLGGLLWLRRIACEQEILESELMIRTLQSKVEGLKDELEVITDCPTYKMIEKLVREEQSNGGEKDVREDNSVVG